MIFGGQNGGANLSDLFELNVGQRTWTFVRTSGTQPAPRWGHVAFAQGLDSMLIFGGGGEGFFSDLLHFSSYKRAWREVCAPGEAPEGRWGHVSVVKPADLVKSCPMHFLWYTCVHSVEPTGNRHPVPGMTSSMHTTHVVVVGAGAGGSGVSSTMSGAGSCTVQCMDVCTSWWTRHSMS